MKKLFFLIILIAAAVGAYLTNPTEAEMRDTLLTKLTAVFNESMQERKSDVVTYTAWQVGGDKMVDLFIEKYVTVHNYYLFSLVKIHWDNKSYIVGIGGFNNIYITNRLNKELADNIINNAQQMVMDAIPDVLKGF